MSAAGFIFTMRLDGSDVGQITFDELEDWAPDWSPTGNDIVFTREHLATETSAGYDEDLFIVHADGTNLRQITDRPDRVELFPFGRQTGRRSSIRGRSTTLVRTGTGCSPSTTLKSGTKKKKKKP